MWKCFRKETSLLQQAMVNLFLVVFYLGICRIYMMHWQSTKFTQKFRETLRIRRNFNYFCFTCLIAWIHKFNMTFLTEKAVSRNVWLKIFIHLIALFSFDCLEFFKCKNKYIDWIVFLSLVTYYNLKYCDITFSFITHDKHLKPFFKHFKVFTY